MLQAQPSQALAPRRGIILLVVIALLTLFAVVGITFVLYAQRMADASRIFREAKQRTFASGPDTPPDLLLNEFLRQWIYDLDDNQTLYPNGINSVLRGHSLARNMYGYNTAPPKGTSNTVAFNGVGRLHDTTNSYPGQDEYNLVNYMYFQTDGQMHDPEKIGWGAQGSPRPFAGGFNPSYSYPDLNMMCLGAMKADGTIITPSYNRKYLFDFSTGLGNPDWTNGQGKYKLLRNRPQDMGAGFPYPTDAVGDVKNLVGASGGNDSIWVDLGSAIKQLPDGRWYKPLFAPLIIDLDGRVNLNVAGNIRGTGQTHVSNQGIGPWEVNLGPVFNSNPEWSNLLKGGAVTGRYGNTTSPTPITGGQLQTPPANWIFPTPSPMPNYVSTDLPRYYAQMDFDGCTSTFTPSGPLNLPTTATYPSFLSGGMMPMSQGFDNYGAAELANHPANFNYFQPGGSDRIFDPSNTMALLRDLSKKTDLQNSDIGKLCPTTLQTIVPFAAASPRLMVTTISFDVDVPAVTPWSTYATPYSLPGGNYPSGAATPFPTPTSTITNLGNPSSEFTLGDGRAFYTSLGQVMGKVDLNRYLTPYPAPNNDVMPSNPQYNQAVLDRQNLAQDIFLRLVKVTGSFDIISGTGPPTQLQFDGIRWLAQLSVNMVDFIDADDIMTAWNWSAAAPALAASVATMDTIGKGWVVGTELPRVVLNEAYIQVANNPADLPTPPMNKATKPFDVNFWVELYNPFKDNKTTPPTDGTYQDNGDAKLQTTPGNVAIYQVVVTNPNTAATFRGANNVLGDPDPANTPPVFTMGQSGGMNTDWSPTGSAPMDSYLLHPSNGASSPGKNFGYYVVGPKATFPGSMGAFTTLQIPATMPTEPLNSGAPNPLKKYDILLRRLANPYIPNIQTPGNGFNPYVTVDYMTSVPSNDGIKFDKMGMHTPAAGPPDASYGRKQPYGADSSEQVAQTAGPMGQPKNTFFSANTPNTNPIDWLVHLDRPLVSPMELLNVSGFKPHELTQQFVQAGKAHQHFAPWYDDKALIYRVFEFLETRNRMAGMPAPALSGAPPAIPLSNRVPGKININTVWDMEIFSALCDAANGNSNAFTQADVQNIFTQMMTSRTPGTTTLSSTDMPFTGYAVGYTNLAAKTQYPQGLGIQNTLLRSNVPGPNNLASPRLIQTQTPTHPYLKNEIMTKLANNVTTRSNTFALWLTVGFFEVLDQTTLPVKLGTEINQSTGQNVRHHMFAIVDRTALSIPFKPIGTSSQAISSTGLGQVTFATAVAGLQPGMIVIVDTGANQESVEVKSVMPAAMPPGSVIGFTAKFNKLHAGGVQIQSTMPGNPGPQPNFFANDSSAVVPYYIIID